jgi:hypothetical protein
MKSLLRAFFATVCAPLYLPWFAVPLVGLTTALGLLTPPPVGATHTIFIASAFIPWAVWGALLALARGLPIRTVAAGASFLGASFYFIALRLAKGPFDRWPIDVSIELHWLLALGAGLLIGSLTTALYRWSGAGA